MRKGPSLWLIGAGAVVTLVVLLAVWSWRNALAADRRLRDYSDALMPEGAVVTGEWTYHCVSGDAFSWLNTYRANTCRVLWLDMPGKDEDAWFDQVQQLALAEGWGLHEPSARGAPEARGFSVTRSDCWATVSFNGPDLREMCKPIPEIHQYCGDIVINMGGPKTGLLP